MRAFRLTAGFTIALFCLSGTVVAFEAPANDGFVTDVTGKISAGDEASLEQTLEEYRRETSNEIAILMVNSLEGEEISDISVEIGRAWGVGTEKDNGILILISYEDRTMHIATGYGLEGAVPDIVAKGIIEEDMVPAFREGDFAGGLSAAIDSLKKHIGGEYTAERYDANGDGGGFASFLLFFVFLVVQIFSSLFARTKSWWLGGIVGGAFGIVLTFLFSWWLSIPALVALGLVLDYFLSKAGPSARRRHMSPRGPWGGGRGGGGGGFGGFGGGSFGGGGASGKW